MWLRAWSQACFVHLVFLSRPNIPGSGLEISSLCPFSIALVFPWPFHDCCLQCQVLILLSVCWSLQLDQKWTDEEGVWEEEMQSSTEDWTEVGATPKGHLNIFPKDTLCWCELNCWYSWLCCLPFDGGCCSSGLFSSSFAIKNVGKYFIISNVKHIR